MSYWRGWAILALIVVGFAMASGCGASGETTGFDPVVDAGDEAAAPEASLPTGSGAEVTTYAVGLAGSNELQLQQIATAGGGSAFFVGNGNTEEELLAALQAIQGEQLACEIPVPEPTRGEFDPMLVNVI